MKMKKLLLLGLMMAIGTSLSAGTVKMTTSKAAGETLSFAVNSGLTLTLTWGDGSTESLVSTGMLQNVTIKNEQLTISCEKDITSLYVAENGLTTLDISGSAKTLRTLCCADNQLKTLSLTNCSNLVILDCQGNQLTSLSNPSKNMQDMNVADNQLTATGLSSTAGLLSMVCANNKIKTITSLANMTNLTALFCQGNLIETLPLANLVNLKHLVASDNSIKTLTFKSNSSALTDIEDIWVSNNELTALDLSEMKKIVGIVAANNKLASVKWDYSTAKRNVKYADLSGNSLPFNSLPNLYSTVVSANTVDGSVSPQTDVQMISGSIAVNEKTTTAFSDLIGRSGWNNLVKAEIKVVDGNGNELKDGVDYKFESNINLTFLTAPHENVVLSFTSPSFPDMVMTSAPFNVTGSTDGIETLENEALDLNNSKIFDLQGRQMDASTLKEGIYIINGKKVIVR